MHVFEQARLWGSPVIYWTRPFEHKHKVFKELIHRSNHKNELVWVAKQDLVNQSLRFVYPHYVFRASDGVVRSTVLENNLILYERTGASLGYAIVKEVQDHAFIIRPLKAKQCNPDHNCPELATMVKEKQISIPCSQFRGLMNTIDGYVNEYALLNIIKK